MWFCLLSQRHHQLFSQPVLTIKHTQISFCSCKHESFVCEYLLQNKALQESQTFRADLYAAQVTNCTFIVCWGAENTHQLHNQYKCSKYLCKTENIMHFRHFGEAWEPSVPLFYKFYLRFIIFQTHFEAASKLYV